MIRSGRFGDIWSLREAVEQLLEAANQPRPTRTGEAGRYLIPIDVWQTPEEVVVRAALPGVQPENIEVTCEEGVLAIGAHSESDAHNYYAQEIAHGEFSRRIVLPAECRAQEARAEFNQGLLTVRVPKVQPTRPRAVKVEVTPGGDAKIKMEKNRVVEAVKGEGYHDIEQRPKSAKRLTPKRS